MDGHLREILQAYLGMNDWLKALWLVTLVALTGLTLHHRRARDARGADALQHQPHGRWRNARLSPSAATDPDRGPISAAGAAAARVPRQRCSGIRLRRYLACLPEHAGEDRADMLGVIGKVELLADFLGGQYGGHFAV